MFNIGRTWTEFPSDCTTIPQLLECLRTGDCHPGGEAGSSIKLAHNFFGVAVRYIGSNLATRPQSKSTAASNQMLQMLVGGGRRLRNRDLLKMVVADKLKTVGRRIARPFSPAARPQGGTALLRDLFDKSIRSRIGEHPTLTAALRDGRAPLSEHEAMFALMGALNRDVTRGIFESVSKGLGRGELAPIFDSLSAVAAQQFLMLPYYFSLFHQNREREHLPRITGFGNNLNKQNLRVALFTDCFACEADAARFSRSMGAQAAQRGLHLTVHTCDAEPSAQPWVKNFQPLASCPLPLFPAATLNVPPVAEVLEWADRQQFDVIHVDTFGPMGLMGWLAAKMLRIPLVWAFHLDLPALAKAATGDYRLTSSLVGATSWFYQQADTMLAVSHASEARLAKLGVDADRIRTVPAEFDASAFDPDLRDVNYWALAGVREPHRILYRGPVTIERNLPMLCQAFQKLSKLRNDVALVVIGEGAYLETMREKMAGLPVYFNPSRESAANPLMQRAIEYASSDLFVYPSAIDTSARSVIEAQASGLPVLVSDQTASVEMMDNGVSGLALPPDKPEVWAQTIDQLLGDEARRQWMGRTAPHRITRFARPRALDMLFDEYLRVSLARRERAAVAPDIAATSGERVAQTHVEVATP